MYPVHRYKKGGDEQAYGGERFFTFQHNLQNIFWFGKMMIMSGPGFSLSSLQRHMAAGYIAPARQVAGRSRWQANHLHSTLTLPLTTTLEKGLQNFQKKLDKFWSKTLSILVNFNYNQRVNGKEKLAKLPGSFTTLSLTFPHCARHTSIRHHFNTGTVPEARA